MFVPLFLDEQEERLFIENGLLDLLTENEQPTLISVHEVMIFRKITKLPIKDFSAGKMLGGERVLCKFD